MAVDRILHAPTNQPHALVSIDELILALNAGSLTSEALCTAYLDRIETLDVSIKAWAHLNPDITLSAARASDARRARGQLRSALDGLPFGIKDNIDTAEFPTELGSAIHSGRRPGVDASVVTRLKGLGLVPLGKTVTTPFGMNVDVATLNPFAPDRTLGASSVGSAAAVSAGMVPLTVNTQNTSSTTRPATYAGVCSFKPSHGSFDLSGTLTLSPGLTQIAFMAPQLRDLHAFATALYGTAPKSHGPLSIAAVGGPWWQKAKADTVAEFDAFCDRHGLREQFVLPSAFGRALEAHFDLIGVGMVEALKTEYEMHREHLPEEAVSWIEHGQRLSAEKIREVQTLRHRLGTLFDMPSSPDILITLAVPGEPPIRHDGLGDGTFSMPWTFCGFPTLSMPFRRDNRIGSVGLQLIGGPGAETSLFENANGLIAV